MKYQSGCGGGGGGRTCGGGGGTGGAECEVALVRARGRAAAGGGGGPTPVLLADMTGQFDLVASPENGGLCLPEPTQGVVLATALAVHTGPERVQERCGEDHHPDQGNMLVRLRMVVLATAAPGRADSVISPCRLPEPRHSSESRHSL